MLAGLISCGSVYCVAYAGKRPKCRKFDQIFTFWKLLCSPPYQSRSNLAANSRPTLLSTLTCQISFESVHCGTKEQKTQFWANFDSGAGGLEISENLFQSFRKFLDFFTCVNQLFPTPALQSDAVKISMFLTNNSTNQGFR